MISAVIAAASAIIAVLLTQFMAEAYRRFKDGSALAAGLWGELSAYEEALLPLKIALGMWQQIEHGHQELTLRKIEKPVDVYYASAVGKIGLLDPDLVGDVVYVYANISGFRVGFAILTDAFKEMGVDEFRNRSAHTLSLVTNAEARAQTLLPKLLARSRENFLTVAKVIAFFKSVS